MNQWNNFNVTVLYKTTWKVKGIFDILWSPFAKEYSKTLEEKKQNQIQNKKINTPSNNNNNNKAFHKRNVS